MSFILQYAKPALPEPTYREPVRYDEKKQMLVFVKDGTPVCEDKATLLVMSTTTSTAGSKTHFDD